MKTVKNLMIAIALLLVVNNSIFATEANIKVVGNKTFVLSVESPVSSISISLIDDNNYDLYSQNIQTKESNFIKKFDLTSLPNGEYKLKVEDALKVTTVLVKIANDKIVSEEIKKEAILKPVIYVRGENVFVNGLATSNDPLYITVFQEGYGLVHNEILANDTEKGRIYKFRYSGEYTIKLSSNGKTYSYNVNVKNDSKTKTQIISLEK